MRSEVFQAPASYTQSHVILALCFRRRGGCFDERRCQCVRRAVVQWRSVMLRHTVIHTDVPSVGDRR